MDQLACHPAEHHARRRNGSPARQGERSTAEGRFEWHSLQAAKKSALRD
jgi:hypothetical protein